VQFRVGKRSKKIEGSGPKRNAKKVSLNLTRYRGRVIRGGWVERKTMRRQGIRKGWTPGNQGKSFGQKKQERMRGETNIQREDENKKKGGYKR